VIHHFSSPERRIEALKELLRITQPGSPILVFVWAHEQNVYLYNYILKGLISKFLRKKIQGKRAYVEQDVFVPWKLAKSLKVQDSTPDTLLNPKKEEIVYQRYYHMFKQGELEDLILRAGGKVRQSGYDRDNWYCIFAS
jgi:tRNA (uracil-5-)-methyltransferase TRM9